ncbi:recombinase family protein [Mesorhizobium sp. M0088]|uniref:recombinase family protein n=1 Tax=Mesorhizobium sp. M0088 TaxID=2956873 RepID=UPI00333CCD7B
MRPTTTRQEFYPTIARLSEAAATSYRGIADALNGRGVRTARGGRWQVSNVRYLVARAPTGFC